MAFKTILTISTTMTIPTISTLNFKTILTISSAMTIPTISTLNF